MPSSGRPDHSATSSHDSAREPVPHDATTRRANVRRRVQARSVRELREAATYGVRAPIRPRRRDARELFAGRDGRDDRMARAGIHRGPLRGDGVQPGPRTARRELPAGLLGVREATIAVVVASLVFVVAAWNLNPLCALLSPIALGWVLWYSYTKRFTHWSHIVLGVGLAIAPVGGYLAVAGAWSTPWWMLIALAAGVSSWTAGFDILYALQDEEFDRAERLHSIPVFFGRRGALAIARGLHVVTIASLAAVGP